MPDACIEAVLGKDSLEDEILSGRSPVQEQHIDFLLEEELVCNPSFLAFLVDAASENSTIAREDATRKFPRANPDSCRAIRSVTTAYGESDVLVVYRSREAPSRRIAILIEDKIKAGFQKEQAKRYRLRGNDGRGKNWDDFWTCLVSPSRYSSDCADFDSRISLEEIHDFFSGADDPRSRFKARVLQAAIDDFSNSGLRVEDQTITEFRRFYSAQAESHCWNADREIEWPLPRRAWWGDTWFRFRSKLLPPRSGIIHKCASGLVHLYFENLRVAALQQALSLCVCPYGLKAVQTGKSSSFELAVPPITQFDVPIEQTENLRLAFEAVEALMQFWTANEDIIMKQIRDASERSDGKSGEPN